MCFLCKQKRWAAACSQSDARDCDAPHHDRLHRIVILGRNFGNLVHDVHTRGDLPEDWMLRCARREPIEILVVCHVDEELRAARIRTASVRHRQSAGRICVPGDVLVLDVAAVGAALGAPSFQILERAIFWTASARFPRLGILRMRAPELIHETRDDAVEVDTFVESRLTEVNEIRCRDGHPVQENLSLEHALGRVEDRCGVGGLARAATAVPRHGTRMKDTSDRETNLMERARILRGVVPDEETQDEERQTWPRPPHRREERSGRRSVSSTVQNQTRSKRKRAKSEDSCAGAPVRHVRECAFSANASCDLSCSQTDVPFHSDPPTERTQGKRWTGSSGSAQVNAANQWEPSLRLWWFKTNLPARKKKLSNVGQRTQSLD